MKNNYYLITISGNDRPGITSMLTQEISKYHYQLIDIGQSVILGFLTLSALVNTQSETEDEFFKSLLFECKKKNLNFEYREYPDQLNAFKPIQYEKFDRYVLTCVSFEQLHAPFISSLAKLMSENNFNIEKINNSSDKDNFRILEISVAATKNQSTSIIKDQILSLASKYNTDVAVVDNDQFRFNKRLIVFDMDSTLIEQEVIDEIARVHGCFDQVQSITHSAMNGEIDFKKSLELRVAHLKGLKSEMLENIKLKLTFTPGTKECIKRLKSLGFKTAIISGGFKPFTEFVKKQLDMDYDFGNNLEIIDGILSGKVIHPIIDAAEKANILRHLAMREGIQLHQTVAVGDGSNDLLMLKTAGMGIAFHAKEIVQKKSQFQLNHGPMTCILPMLGLAT